MSRLIYCITQVILLLAITVNAANVFSEETSVPVINEIMSLNTSVIQDEDGDTPDWIELYNPGTEPVDITGYGLTDDTDRPFQWVFPAVTLYPHQFKTIFASGKDRSPIVKHWETVINWGDEWHYFIGDSEPPATWISNTFDDSSWLAGPSGFGFGDNDDATVIPQVMSVYLRASFTVGDVENISRCLLHHGL